MIHFRTFSIVLLIVFCALALGALPPAGADPAVVSSSIVAQPMDPNGPDQPAYSGCNTELAPQTNADYEQQLIELVNAERASNDLPPLKRTTALDQAARYYATDMAQDDYFQATHATYDRVDGALTEVCGFATRVGNFYPAWSTMSENIAAGYTTPASVMQGWMASEGHRDNLLSSSVREIGLGYAQGGAYGRYWVQDFGRRSNVYPLIIAAESALTAGLSIPMYAYGSWTEMRLRNESGVWSAWMPFQNEFTWALSAGSGDKTVTVEMRTGGTTVSSSDTIFYIDIDSLDHKLFLPAIFDN